MRTLYDHAGGEEALHRLEELFYSKVLSDPVLKVLFTERLPGHVDHLTWFTAESFGGPDRFTRELGFQHIIDVHRHLKITDEQRQRFVALYMEALDEAGLPQDAPFLEAVRSHLEFGSRVAQQNSRAESDAELHPIRQVPRWEWPDKQQADGEDSMNADATSKLVRELYGAYESDDPSVLERTLADDFTFTSPYDDHISRSAYFARCWPNHDRIRSITIEKLVVNGDEVFVLLHVRPRDGASFRNVEYLVFAGSQLKKVEVYFGDPPDGVSREDYPRFLAMASEAWKASARGTR